MDSTPEGLVQAGIDTALAIPDPADRARAISGILGIVKAANPELKAKRQEDVLELRAKPMKLRELAELLGMSTGRVDQIAKGK